MEKKYLHRVIDEYLTFKLEATGAVLIEGAKYCGKTSTAKEKASSVLSMQDPDHAEANIQLASLKPSLLLQGDTPRLIDEWQIAPVLWDAVRHMVDERNETGQFILTGSAVPVLEGHRHTGTGRISRVMMRPMSLYESKESNGMVSLKDLFDGKRDIEGISTLSIEQLAFAISRGGWPATLERSNRVALQNVFDYVDAVTNEDVSRVDGVERDAQRVRLLMRSYARNISTMASNTTICNDMAADETVSDKTVASYIHALKQIYVIEDVPAWSPSLRSKTAIRTSSKRQFVDPSIAVATLRTTPERLLRDFHTFGYLFESLCVRDLRVYSQINDGAVYHYRDKNKLKADIIVELFDGRWGAIEVKLGLKEVDEAAKNLIKLRGKINTKKMQEPSFLMVLTGGQYAYCREDGVLVVPLGCLKD